MFQALQRTLSSPAEITGVGVHSGRETSLRLRPAAAGTGVVFCRTDVADRDNRVAVSPETVTAAPLHTRLVNAAGVEVLTVEHLLAAFAGLGVDNVRVEIDGAEVPIMDGSAQPFVDVIDSAGRRTQPSPRRYLEILEPVEVLDGAKRAALLPALRFEMAFEIDFSRSAAIGRQAVDLAVDEASFRRELAAARTFGFLEEVEALRGQGLCRGGGLDNAVVLDGDRVLNPEGLRFQPDEFVRHKALDAVGDLYVLGAPVIGRFEGRYAGHAINNALVRALAARPEAWRWRTFAAELAEAV